MIHRRYGLTIAAATAAALLTACQGGGAAALSVSGLTKTADALPDKGAAACPLSYDIAKAAKAAGMDGEAGKGSLEDPDDQVATGEGGKRTVPGDALAENPGALVTCHFHVGREDVDVYTIATEKRPAIAPLAPMVQYFAEVSVEDLSGFLKEAGDAKPGVPVATENGAAAAVRLRLEGEGDAYVLVGIEKPAGAAPSDGKRITALAKALAGQVG